MSRLLAFNRYFLTGQAGFGVDKSCILIMEGHPFAAVIQIDKYTVKLFTPDLLQQKCRIRISRSETALVTFIVSSFLPKSKNRTKLVDLP